MLGQTASSSRRAPFFSMGRQTYQASFRDVFGANREKLVSRLRRAHPEFFLQDGDGEASNEHVDVVVYLEGGKSATRFDSDHEPLFRQESYFAWLTGVKEPDCAVAILISGTSGTHNTTLFIPNLPPEYAVFMGHIRTHDEWKTRYDVDRVEYTQNAESYLMQQIRKKQSRLLLMKGPNSDSGLLYHPPKLTFPSDKQAMMEERIDTTTLFPILADCRVIKSSSELELMRHVTEITSMAHVYVMRHCASHFQNLHQHKQRIDGEDGSITANGSTNNDEELREYQLESLFRHYCYYNHGCRLVGYTPICACGPNSAILHYGHAGEPNSRRITELDLCLMDMGTEYCFYGSDVTCSFPASGRFPTQTQRQVYEAVLDAQRSVYRLLKPGVSWVDCHKAAERTLLEHLIRMGIVRLAPDDSSTSSASLEQLIDMRLGAVFMPHGLGHLIGIDTHDVGGYLPGHPSRIPQPGLKSLRTARTLQTNMCLTVEPGLYFIDHLLDEALNKENSSLAPYINATLIKEQYRGMGGVRLEDVVVITEDGFCNFTACPRTVDEVESVMNGKGKWPPLRDEAPELGRKRLTDPQFLMQPAH